MTCESCGGKLRVITTVDGPRLVHRYRRCTECGERMQTKEKRFVPRKRKPVDRDAVRKWPEF